VDLRTALRLLRERWMSIVIITLLTAAVGGLYTWQQTPMYTSQTTLYVSSWSERSDASTVLSGSLASQERVKSYTQLVRSERVTTAVKDQLGLAGSPAGEISAATIPNTAMFTIAATDPSPTRAQAIANAAAEQFVKLVPILEASPDGKTQAVRVTVVTPAALPGAPVSPQPVRNLAFSCILGLLAGMALAAARNVLDTTVKGVDQLNDIAGVPSLGQVAADPASAKSPLLSADEPFSHRAEAFRKIRTGLQFVDVDRSNKVILVTSAVAGEGKTSTACNLAITLAEAGKSVLLIDADLRRPRASKYLGLPAGVGLTSVLVGSASLAEATQQWGDLISVLASGPIPPNPSELLGSRHMRDLIDGLRQWYDVVVIDGPPVLPVADATVTAAAVDGTILLVRYGRTRREQVQATVNALRSVDAKILGTVLNMVPTGGRDGYYYYYQEYGPKAAETSGRQSRKAAAKSLQTASRGDHRVPL